MINKQKVLRFYFIVQHNILIRGIIETCWTSEQRDNVYESGVIQRFFSIFENGHFAANQVYFYKSDSKKITGTFPKRRKFYI